MMREERGARLQAAVIRVASQPRRPVVAGAMCGVIAGIALGMFAGPVGLIVGLFTGVAIGFISGLVLAEEDGSKSMRTRELDAIIGVTAGSIGSASFTPSEPTFADEEAGEPLSSKEAWLAEWLTPPPPGCLPQT